MNSLQWKAAFNSGALTAQELPFDHQININLEPIYDSIEQPCPSSMRKDSFALLSLSQLLNRYNQAASSVHISIENQQSELVPSLISISNYCTHGSLEKKIETVLATINNPDSLTCDQLNELHKDEMESLSIPVNQCCFSANTKSTKVKSSGHLHFYITNQNDVGLIGIKYNRNLFNEITVRRMLDDWTHTSNIFLSCAGTELLSDIQTISPDNRVTLLNRWNDSDALSPDFESMHRAFERNVDLNPEKVCVSDIDKNYSYLELEHESNHIAWALINFGIEPGDLVAIALPRNVQLVSSILGVFKSIAAYVPLDPDFPDDRLAYMADHSHSKALITTEKLKDRFSFISGPVITLESILANKGRHNHRPSLASSPNNTAYVIYTSGSTGKPKGVEVLQSGVLNLLQSMQKSPGTEPDDVFCALTTLSFDISVIEILLPLYSGASVVIVEKEVSLFADKFASLLDKFSVTFLQATPATFRLLISQEWFPSTKMKVLCGGEPFPVDLAISLLARADSVWNVYGPTETTVWSTVHQVETTEPPIFIGRPIDNTSIYILDSKLQLVPIGMPGNLYIGGAGLAKGYLNQRELTEERFTNNPFKPGKKIYDTGDIAKYTADGLIECLGRSDGQVKIRGYRIEPGEIESCLSKHIGIESQVVIAREDEPGNQQLVAYYQTKDQLPLSEHTLKLQLSSVLPKYMIPNRLVHLLEFPMTLNYKIDRKALPKPEGPITSTVANRPITETEHLLFEIWKGTLGIKTIDTHANFFDIGGNSLLSIRIFTEIKKQLNLNLPLDTLFNYSNINALANHLDELKNPGSHVSEEKHSPKNLVTINAHGKGKPVFFFHGVGGNVLNYIRLVKSIGSDRPAYGLQSSGVDGVSSLESSYENMLTSYLESIQSIQRHGPYTLVGGSMGGVTALDIAKKMTEAGLSVERVVMFDSFGPHLEITNHDIPKTTQNSRLTRIKDFTQYKLKMLSSRIAPPIYSALNLQLPHKIRYQWIENNNFKLMAMRNPVDYTGPVTLIRAPLQNTGPYSDPNLGWGKTITGKLSIHLVEGDHHNIVESETSMSLFSDLLSENPQGNKLTA